MNISILERVPDLSVMAKLIIQPLAPLSMVTDIPGTYYKTQTTPDKFKVCGLFENILGWHFSVNDREKIDKALKTVDKDREYKESNSTYKPLLYDYFEITLIFSASSIQYNDLWKKSFRRADADVHPKGTPNLDYELLKRKKSIREKEREQKRLIDEIRSLKKEEEKNRNEINRLREKLLPGNASPLLSFFKQNIEGFPIYYTSPTLREYISFDGEVQFCLKMDESLLILLENILEECSTGYLGNSEGWVEIKIERL